MTLQERINKINELNQELNQKYQSDLDSLINEFHLKKQSIKETKPKQKEIYHPEISLYVSLNNFKKNTNYQQKFYHNKQWFELEINVFKLITNNHTFVEGKDCDYDIIFDYIMPNAELRKENDLTIIKYHYVYEKKYQGLTIDLENIEFDYNLILEEGECQNLYYFENEYGKFRVDLSIELC